MLALPAFATDTVYYYLSDSLHSEVVVTDAHRNVVEQTYYAPYGQVLNRNLRDGPGYTGHEEDPATGLVYMQQRYYDPQSGRFLSTDPVLASGNGGSFNRYAYAKDNPYRYIDPTGMCTGTHICNPDGTTVSTGTFTTMPQAGDALRARVATTQSRLNQAVNYMQRHEKDVSGSYASPGKAAGAFGNTFAAESGKLGVEFGANIVGGLGDGGGLSYSLMDFSVSTYFKMAGPYAGLAQSVAIPGRPGDISYWGFVHTHYANYDPPRPFSWPDIQVMINRRVNGYVYFPDGSSSSFDYSKYNPLTMSPAYVYWNQSKFNL